MSEMSVDSPDSEINFIPEVEIENACRYMVVKSNFPSNEDNFFSNEPLVGEAWTAR